MFVVVVVVLLSDIFFNRQFAEFWNPEPIAETSRQCKMIPLRGCLAFYPQSWHPRRVFLILEWPALLAKWFIQTIVGCLEGVQISGAFDGSLTSPLLLVFFFWVVFFPFFLEIERIGSIGQRAFCSLRRWLVGWFKLNGRAMNTNGERERGGGGGGGGGGGVGPRRMWGRVTDYIIQRPAYKLWTKAVKFKMVSTRS